MEYIAKTSRSQLTFFPTALDSIIEQDNTVRVIDVFVDSLDFSELNFNQKPTTGRPAYDPADLLKLYLYGYINRIRSSRQLEKECKRNIEVIWLLGSLKPDHNTINRFRKQNNKSIRKVFQQTVNIAKNFNLIGGLLIAGDSTKLRAQNSKKNNYNKKKIERHLEYIDKKLKQYNAILDDNQATQQHKQEAKDQIQKHNTNKIKYQEIRKQLLEDKTTENPQISTSDPESRHQIVRGQITEVCYTAQTTVDQKNKILIDYQITNQNDKKAMGYMLSRAVEILEHNEFTALYDKGYHTGSEFKTAHDLGIQTLVAIPNIGRASQAPDPRYNAEHFIYSKQDDSYTCPQGNTLKSNGKWYNARNYKFKQYKTKACATCFTRSSCTTAKQNGKIIQRSQYKQYIEDNKERVKANQNLYKKRQALVEHPYGTIKRQWGFDHIMTKKGINRASADFGLIAIAYNLKRIINILKNNKQNPLELISGLVLLFLSFSERIFSIFKHKFHNKNLKNNMLYVA